MILECSTDIYDGVIVFFFQAEDGIRDYKVTGVQTCALPIYPRADPGPHRGARGRDGALADPLRLRGGAQPHRRRPRLGNGRSEERRVGKESKNGWATYR